MTTFAVNENNDLFLGADGNLVILETGINATLEVCEHYAKAQRGEMIYQVNQGVPYDRTAFDNLNLSQFRGQLGRQLSRVANVQEVSSLEVVQSGESIEYTAVIKTAFGEGAIDGEL